MWGRGLPSIGVRGHHDQVIQEHSPCVQAHTEAVDAWLLERILVEEVQELQHRKQGIKLHPLQVRRHKPVEEVGTLGQESKQEGMVLCYQCLVGTLSKGVLAFLVTHHTLLGPHYLIQKSDG